MAVRLLHAEEALAEQPSAIFVPPYTSILPEQVISSPTRAALIATSALWHTLGNAPQIGFSGEEYADGWRTGEGMHDALRYSYGIPEQHTNVLPGANSTPSQILRMREWLNEDHDAIIVGHANHLRRIARICQAGRMNVGLVAVRDVLHAPATAETAQEMLGDKTALDYWRSLTEFFDKKNTKYELIPLALTRLMAPWGLDVMADVFDRITQRTGANQVDVTGGGTQDDPFVYKQHR